MGKSTFIACLLFTNLALGQDVRSVEAVEFAAYSGDWYELQRIPNSFQYDKVTSGFGRCEDTVAHYESRDDGKITVINTCNRIDEKGERKQEVAQAVATVVEGSGGSRLEVNFTGLAVLRWLGVGNGDYWVLGLGPRNDQGQYSWALVGEPSRRFGWILSRTTDLPAATLQSILQLAESNGYARSDFTTARTATR
jgi:apolipoprotein D and lipocalin family protein